MKERHDILDLTCSGPASWKWPWPSWPCRPRPHVHSPPLWLTTTVWFAPAATCVTLTLAMEVTWRGMSTSMGVHPPCPSSPDDARPQVRRMPSGSSAAQWLAPQLTISTAVGSAKPVPARETVDGAAASSYPPWPSCPWNPRPKVYSVRPRGRD